MNTWILQLNPLAATWLAALWRACWQGGLAFLLVWAVCRAFHRLPARAKSWLWRLAYLKLLAAFLCATPIDVPLLPARTPPPAPQAQLAGVQPRPPRFHHRQFLSRLRPRRPRPSYPPRRASFHPNARPLPPLQPFASGPTPPVGCC